MTPEVRAIEAHRDEVQLRVVGRLLGFDRLVKVEPRAVRVPECLRVKLHGDASLHRGDRSELPAAGVEHADREVFLVLRLTAAELKSRAAQHRDTIARWRPCRIRVVAGLGRQAHGGGAWPGARLPQVAAGGIAPRDVGDPLPVRGDVRRVLARRQPLAVGRQSPRCTVRLAIRKFLQPDPSERLKGEEAAVGRLARPAQDSRLHGTLLDFLLPGHARREELLDMGGERNLGARTARELDAHQLAAIGEHDCGALGRECVIRPQIELPEAFLLVPRQWPRQDPLDAGA